MGGGCLHTAAVVYKGGGRSSELAHLVVRLVCSQRFWVWDNLLLLNLDLLLISTKWWKPHLYLRSLDRVWSSLPWLKSSAHECFMLRLKLRPLELNRCWCAFFNQNWWLDLLLAWQLCLLLRMSYTMLLPTYWLDCLWRFLRLISLDPLLLVSHLHVLAICLSFLHSLVLWSLRAVGNYVWHTASRFELDGSIYLHRGQVVCVLSLFDPLHKSLIVCNRHHELLSLLSLERDVETEG